MPIQAFAELFLPFVALTIFRQSTTIYPTRYAMKTLVIGGGMAGLTYAIVACNNGEDVTVAERNSRVGKKLAMTGNGKCNLGNEIVTADRYNDSEIVRRVLAAISVDEYRRFLHGCGIFTYTDSEGRIYPLSDSASNVVDCLRYKLAQSDGKLLTDALVTGVAKRKDDYAVDIGGSTYEFDKVVVACGSRSQAGDTCIERLVPATALTPMFPSLVPVKAKNADGMLNGLRARAVVRLFDRDALLGTQRGEVLFRDYGLSGICIFNLSALIARRKVAGLDGDYRFEIDVVPDMNEVDLSDIVGKRFRSGEGDKAFYGILHNKLGEYVLRRAGNDATAAAHLAKHLEFYFDRLLDWSMSQVAAGGVDEAFVDVDALRLGNGVTVLGEALNVDGLCGGYNLYFAAASALYVFAQSERAKLYLV